MKVAEDKDISQLSSRNIRTSRTPSFLSSLSVPLLSNASALLYPSDIDLFLQDLACLTTRWMKYSVLSFAFYCFTSRFSGRKIWVEGMLAGAVSSVGWKFRCLSIIVSRHMMITRMEEWNPQNVTAASFKFERISLLGPLCRLGVFLQEWVCYLSCFFFCLNIECLIF